MEKQYRLLKKFESPTRTIHIGVSKTESEWQKLFPDLEENDCEIKADWFEKNFITTPSAKDDLIDDLIKEKHIMKKIKLTTAEIQSKSTRLDWAEGLILQLPENHQGRNSWLLNYGVGKCAREFRKNLNLRFNKKTRACEIKSYNNHILL